MLLCITTMYMYVWTDQTHNLLHGLFYCSLVDPHPNSCFLLFVTPPLSAITCTCTVPETLLLFLMWAGGRTVIVVPYLAKFQQLNCLIASQPNLMFHVVSVEHGLVIWCF